MKTCAMCKASKPEEDFNRKGKWRQPYCRPCQVVYRKDHYQINRDEIIRVNTERKLGYRAASRAYVVEYLQAHPCVDCGESDIDVLEFDHVRGTKEFNVGQYVAEGRSPNLDRLIAEIAKCQVRCANCHRRVTKKRRLAPLGE